MAGVIKTLLLDIGGVLLTDGWPSAARQKAAATFGFDFKEFESRHQAAFETYEMDRMTMDEYLNITVFNQPRSFTKETFTDFFLHQSKPLEGHLDYFIQLKEQHKLKVFAVSNEARELNEYRITTFRLDRLFDAYVSSCYIQRHKPDKQMLQIACDMAHTRKEEAVYVDDRMPFVQTAEAFGIKALHFTGLESAEAFFAGCNFLNS